MVCGVFGTCYIQMVNAIIEVFHLDMGHTSSAFASQYQPAGSGK